MQRAIIFDKINKEKFLDQKARRTVSNMKPRIVIKDAPQNRREYHVNILISLCSNQLFVKPFDLVGETQKINKVGGVGSALVNRVLSVNGVVSLFIESYYISVAKGLAFEWDDINDHILEAVKKCFPVMTEDDPIKVIFYQEEIKKEEREPFKMPIKMK